MSRQGRPGLERVDPRWLTAQVVDEASEVASYLLAGNSERLAHSTAVADRAQLLTAAVPAEAASVLVAAAWLHDIGYIDTLRVTGFHPVDGGLHLRRTGWPPVVAGLVAHHSGARFVAAARGLGPELAVFEYREDSLSDALTIADQTAGPGGVAMTVPKRLADMLDRHGEDSPNARAHAERQPYLLAAAARVIRRLEQAGIPAEQHHIL